MFLKYFFLATINIICIKAVCDRELLQPLEWTSGKFEWADKTMKSIYKTSGRYVSKNIIATRAQIAGDYAYLALPRFREGVAATLAQISLKPTGGDPVLKPFPCWLTQEVGNCQALQSVVDVFLDSQDVLWALDIGVTKTLESPVRQCPPKVVAFSVKTGKLLKSIDLSGLVSQGSRLQYVVVEYAYDKPIVYVSDAATRSILVYDVVGGKGYRIVLPKAITTGGNRKDVLYLALVRKGCGNNFLVFTYLSSKRIFSIRSDYLRSGSTAGRIVDLGPKADKLVILGTDLGSAIFFRYEGQPQIYRWDTNNCFKSENFQVVYRSNSCFLATHAIPDVRRQRIRVLQSNFPDYIQKTVGCGAVQQLNVMAGNC